MRAFAVGETGRTPLDLEPHVLLEFRETHARIAEKSVLLWDEHCSECAMPSCFATCSLYTPRQDLKCRRFARGIEALVATPKSDRPISLLSVAFRRWGKLEARGEAVLVSSRAADFLERVAFDADRLADRRSLPPRLGRKAGKAVDLFKIWAARRLSRPRAPDVFVLEVLNTGTDPIRLTVTVKPEAPGNTRLFQGQAEINPGYNRHCFSAAEIYAMVGEAGPMLFQIEPVETQAPLPTLIFGVIDFVTFVPVGPLDTARQPWIGERRADRAFTIVPSISPPNIPPAPDASASKVKCVVWDLDNVMWSGTLVEDGPDGVQLNPKVAAIIVELDRRGILNSIASKNAGSEPEELLKRFGLWDYFLYPQIHWRPKSGSLSAISNGLNIGIDSLVFIDDQPFERGEVEHAHPSVQVFDVDVLDTLLDQPRFDVAITEEGRQRRSMYQVEQVRLDALGGADGDYDAFLRGCDIKLQITDLDENSINRAFELTERTNQLNYSGLRLSRSELEARSTSPNYSTLVLSVSDRFGDYGVIGVAVLNLDRWEVECFFMSCRVQRKKVEHAFFQHLLSRGAERGKPRLTVVYRPTPRNEPSRVVLEDEMKFHIDAQDGGDVVFQRATTDIIPDSGIVKLDDRSALNPSLKALLGAGIP